MAALLRATCLRVCRNLALLTPRNHLSYLRQVQTPTVLRANIAVVPRIASVRLLSDVIPDKHAQYQYTQSVDNDQRSPLDSQQPRGRIMSDAQYERIVQKLGSLSTKGSLFQLFDSILAKDGKFTQLQAYQMLRNCGKELMYESPENRTDTAHVIWDKLLASGVQVDIMMYNALLSVYIQNDYDFNPLEVLEQIQDAGLEPNLITLTLIIKGFGEKGDIAGVFKVLEFMKAAEMPVTEPVYAALITAYWRNGDMESSKGVFNMMRENGLDPGIESYTTLLRAFAEDGDLVAIDETITEMQEKKIYPNHTVYLSLIDVFAKCGKLEVIPKILEKPTVKRLVEIDIRSMMLTLAGRGDIDAALVLMDFVPHDNISSPAQTPQFLLLKQVIIAKQPIDKIMKVVDTLNREGIMRNVYETALHLSYARKEPETSLTIIQEMLAKGVVVKQHYFYPIFACYADNLEVKGTQDTVTLMSENGLDIDPISLSYIIKSFGQPKDADVDAFIKLSKEVPLSLYLVKTIAQLVMESGNTEKLESIFEYAENNIGDKSFFPQIFSRAMKRSFDPHNALNILRELKKRELTLLLPFYVSDILENHCRQENNAKEGAQFIHLMLQEELQDLIDSRSYTSVMKYLNINQLHDDFYELIRVMKDHKIPLDEHQYRQMIRMFSYLGESRAAQFCFNSFKKLKEPDSDLYSLVISAYGHSKYGGFLAEPLKEHNPKRILQLYEEMKESDMKPKSRAKGYVIMSYLALGNLEEAIILKQEFGHLGALAYRVQSSFLKVYADKGDTENVAKVIQAIKNTENMHLSAYAYTTAISAYKFSGDIETQRKLLKEMEEMNLKPTAFTYDELLGTYLLKEDLDGALQILEEAKSCNSYPTSGACMQLAKLCGKLAPDKLDSVVHEMLDVKVKGRSESSHSFFMHGLVCVCVSRARTDLAEQIIQRLPHHSPHEYGKVAASFARSGDFEGILKCKIFLEEKSMDSNSLLIPLIRAYDHVNKPLDALEAYETFVASGGRAWAGLQIILAKILEKHDQQVPFKVPERGQRQRLINTESAEHSQSDEESAEHSQPDLDEVHQAEDDNTVDMDSHVK